MSISGGLRVNVSFRFGGDHTTCQVVDMVSPVWFFNISTWGRGSRWGDRE